MDSSRLDENLIVRMGAGDASAFRELYAATSDLVFGFALSIVKNDSDAEDVMHDAYIKVFQSAASYQPFGKPMAWILTIVRNLAFNKIRQRKPTIDLSECEHITAASRASDPVDRMVLEAALEVLDLEERQIVILHALAELKHREIAHVMQIPLGTALSKYHRALGKLRREIEGRGEMA